MFLSLYSCYSSTHKKLYENYFMRTLPFQDVCLRAYEIPQVCPSGEFRQNGWNLMGLEKAKIMLNACQTNDIFVFSDCDVVFFKPIAKELIVRLGDFDLIGQDDGKGICSGFFVCRSNERTLAMFTKMVELLSQAKEAFMADQFALNTCIKQVKHAKLPLSCISSVKYFRERAVTNTSDIKEITSSCLPRDMLAFHANWCCSLKLKSLLLERVLALMPDSSMVERAAVNR